MSKVITIDNFFDNPSAITDSAASSTYIKTSGRYPGKRTIDLRVCNQLVHNMLHEKFCLNVYDIEPSRITAYFQKITNLSFGDDYQSIENSGWIHTDDSILSGVIYLNKDCENFGGTSIYEPIPNGHNHDIDINSYKKAHYSNNYVENEELYKSDKMLFSSLFTQTISVKNVFNRAVIFDSSIWHSAEHFVNNRHGERLTLVFFIN